MLERQGLEIVTGEQLGGGEASSAVKDQIHSADSQIALKTRRDKIGESDVELWDTYLLVRDELTYRSKLGRPA